MRDQQGLKLGWAAFTTLLLQIAFSFYSLEICGSYVISSYVSHSDHYNEISRVKSLITKCFSVIISLSKGLTSELLHWIIQCPFSPQGLGFIWLQLTSIYYLILMVFLQTNILSLLYYMVNSYENISLNFHLNAAVYQYSQL